MATTPYSQGSGPSSSRLSPGTLLPSSEMRTHGSDSLLGVDFGAPRRAQYQRRKIIAIEALSVDWRKYRIAGDGVNARLLAQTGSPGWSAQELLGELIARPVRIVAFDFPFCIPMTLLNDEEFAAIVGHAGPFGGWRAFSGFVAQNLKLADPLDFDFFSPWRAASERRRLWGRRATDHEAGGQPPLKDRFQSVFQMTLLGNVLLSKPWQSTLYRVIPFGGLSTQNEAIEVYPGATLRQLGLKNYKKQPAKAVALALQACSAAGITIEADADVLGVCSEYYSGGATPDHDAADALVALCTAILYREGECRAAIGGCPVDHRLEGAIWVPRPGLVGR